MKFFSKLNKLILIFFWISLFFLTVLSIYLINKKDFKLAQDRKSIKKILKDGSLKQNILNDYREVYLPKTQFVNLKYNNRKINNIKETNCYAGKCYTFFMSEYEDKLLLLDRIGNIFFINIDSFLNGNNDFKTISSNLDLDFTLDLYVKENFIYVSGNKKDNNNEYKMSVFKAPLDSLDKISFNEIFSKKDDKCISNTQHSGKIQHLNNNIDDGLLFTTMSVPQLNNPDLDILSDDTVCGKILLIDENTSEFKNYAKGFRNITGLFSEKDLLIATSNGPMGGDEINKILPNENYGWPIASYGDLYFRKNDDKKVYYKKSHDKYGFKEPVFSFVPSIGISEIIKLSNNFSNFWEDNFLVASLNKKTLYRIKFDKTHERIIFLEEIFIGDRIRDVLYLEESQTILLSLELAGEILILNII
jgi:hypothetical protein